LTESEGTEYVRLKTKGENEESLPESYGTKLEWRKAKEIQRLLCGFQGKDHTCVVVEAPIKSWIRHGVVGGLATMSNGISRVMIDTEKGALVAVSYLGSSRSFAD